MVNVKRKREEILEKGKHPEGSLVWLAEQLGVDSDAVYRAAAKVAGRADSKAVGRYRVYRPSALVKIKAEVLRDKHRYDRPRDESGLFVPTHGTTRTHKMLIRLTEEQYQQVDRIAQEKGLTPTELITEVVLKSWLFGGG